MESDLDLISGLDALALWRRDLQSAWYDLVGLLADHELLTPPASQVAQAVAQRLTNDKLVVAFIAEFSRGKSELINAIFFADAGRRILPASPGRTTMCPVEIGWDESRPVSMELLPIESRRADSALGSSLAAWRDQPERWTRVPLNKADADSLADSLQEITRTRRVSPALAYELGMWASERPDDNPPMGEDGLVEIPMWRHALVNYPHPLLKKGLVVLDTPGLNAIGSEPELTLGLLPTAHAALFVLGADTGVTRSDMAIWREHLGGQSMSCYVVLNKVDTLADPLMPAADVGRMIEQQCDNTAAALGISRDRVFPVSARQALTSRLARHPAGVKASRLPALEAALGADLLPRRQQMLGEAVIIGARTLVQHAVHRARELRRSNAEQMLELRGLRGKSTGKVRIMLRRVEQDTTDFEQCGSKLAALKAVHTRQARETLELLAASAVEREIRLLQEAVRHSAWPLKAGRAFAAACLRLRAVMDDAAGRCKETAEMLDGTFRQLNAEFAFSLTVDALPDLLSCSRELEMIQRSYGRYLGLQNALRLRSPQFSMNLVHMLASRIHAVFDKAAEAVDAWNHAAAVQVDTQLREKRRHFSRRHDSLARIQHATDDLDLRLAEVEASDGRLHALILRATERAGGLCTLAGAGPATLPEPSTPAGEAGEVSEAGGAVTRLGHA